jgi:hypothetical protein
LAGVIERRRRAAHQDDALFGAVVVDRATDAQRHDFAAPADARDADCVVGAGTGDPGHVSAVTVEIARIVVGRDRILAGQAPTSDDTKS